MSLTRNDIQILKEVFQPEFVNLYNKIDGIKQTMDKRFEQMNTQINGKFGQVDKRLEDMDIRFVASFAQLDTRITQLENGLSSICRTIVDELYEMYAPREEFDTLENRVTTVEKKLQKHSF